MTLVEILHASNHHGQADPLKVLLELKENCVIVHWGLQFAHSAPDVVLSSSKTTMQQFVNIDVNVEIGDVEN